MISVAEFRVSHRGPQRVHWVPGYANVGNACDRNHQNIHTLNNETATVEINSFEASLERQKCTCLHFDVKNKRVFFLNS